MIIRLKRVLATMPFFVSMALIPLGADNVTAAPEVVHLSPEQLNALAAQADNNRHDPPSISYTYTALGFKITVSRITFDQVVDFTLNGEIITEAITALIGKGIIQVTKNDKGFEFDVAVDPINLGNGAEFGVILDTGLKLSSVIYDDNRSVNFAMGNIYADIIKAVVLPPDNGGDKLPTQNRVRVKGYVKQYDQDNCWWGWGCYNTVPHHWVNIYAHDGHGWVYKDTAQTDEHGFYSLLIENHCAKVAAYTAKDGKEVWQHEEVWTSCSPSINEQSITLKLK